MKSRFRVWRRFIRSQTNRHFASISLEQKRAFLAEKSKHNTRRILFFSLFCAYALLAVLGTSDYDILLKRPIGIPGLRITLPLLTFYTVTPLTILILHFGVVWMHERYRQDLQNIPRKTLEEIPFSILDVLHFDANFFLKLGVNFLVYFFPLLVLLSFFYWFAKYQNLGFTFFHLMCLIICLILDLGFICKFRWPNMKWRFKIMAILPYSFILLFSILFFASFCLFLNSPSDFFEYLDRFLTPDQKKILRAKLPHLEVTYCNLNKNFDLNEVKAYRELDNEKQKRPYLYYITKVDLRGRKLILADLSYSKMVNFDFSGADLRWAKLKKTQLQYSFLENANLQGANLEGADLRETNLKDAKHLGEAILKNANLQGADLKNANLQGANLIGANLEGADLENANLQGANLGRFPSTNSTITKRTSNKPTTAQQNKRYNGFINSASAITHTKSSTFT